MVANVSDAATPGGNSRGSTDTTSNDSDGFLQALLGIAGVMPPVNVIQPPSPPSPPPAASAQDSASADSVSVSAVEPRVLQPLPAWLMSTIEATPVDVPLQQASVPAEFQQALSALIEPTVTNERVQSSSPQTVAALPVAPTASDAPAPTIAPASAAPTTALAGELVNKDAPAAAEKTLSSEQAATPAKTATPALDIEHLLSAGMQAFDGKPSKPKSSKESSSMADAQLNADSSARPALQDKALSTLFDDKNAWQLLGAAPRSDLESFFKLDVKEATKSTVDGVSSDSSTTNLSLAAAAQPSVGNAHDVAEPSRQLHARLGSAEWKDELGAQLNWMVDNGKHSASLKLTPEHLGPVEVRIDVDHAQTSVWFSAAHADTRTALEQALPRLRELMSAQGMSLNDAGVFREPPREQSRNPASHNSASIGFGDAAEETVSISRSRNSLFDAYA